MKITKWISILTVLVLLTSLMAVGVSADESKIRADLLERLNTMENDEPVPVYVYLIDPPKLNEVSIPALIAEKYGITTINADTIDDYYKYERIELTAIYQPFFEEFFEDYKDGIVEKMFVPSHSDFCLLEVYKSTIYEMANDDRVNEIAYFENSILQPEEDGEEDHVWYQTPDGQFLYRPYPYGEEDCVQVMYIGDGTDVTVPATFGGEAFDVIWFTDASAITFGRSDSEQAQTWYDKAEAASNRYLNLTFEEGPTGVKVTPGMYPGSVRATSVTLPKSATGVSLYVEGLNAVSVPEGSALTTFSLYNVPEGWEHPSLAVIDLTGATGLQRVWIGRDEWAGDCFAEGSVLKLPTEFKSVPILRKAPFRLTDEVYFCIDVAPMSLTIQYADGSETSLIRLGDVNEDGSVDMKDVLCIRLYISGCIGHENVLQHIGASVQISADATGDGNIDMKDVLMIRQYIAGLINHLGKAA